MQSVVTVPIASFTKSISPTTGSNFFAALEAVSFAILSSTFGHHLRVRLDNSFLKILAHKIQQYAVSSAGHGLAELVKSFWMGNGASAFRNPCPCAASVDRAIGHPLANVSKLSAQTLEPSRSL
jgi:hypothetical protein